MAALDILARDEDDILTAPTRPRSRNRERQTYYEGLLQTAPRDRRVILTVTAGRGRSVTTCLSRAAKRLGLASEFRISNNPGNDADKVYIVPVGKTRR